MSGRAAPGQSWPSDAQILPCTEQLTPVQAGSCHQLQVPPLGQTGISPMTTRTSGAASPNLMADHLAAAPVMSHWLAKQSERSPARTMDAAITAIPTPIARRYRASATARLVSETRFAAFVREQNGQLP